MNLKVSILRRFKVSTCRTSLVFLHMQPRRVETGIHNGRRVPSVGGVESIGIAHHLNDYIIRLRVSKNLSDLF